VARGRRRQAAKVSFFLDVDSEGQFQLKVVNASDYPILGVTAVVPPRTSNAVAVVLTPNLLRTGHTPYTMPWRPGVLSLHFADLNTEHPVLFGVELWFEDSNSVYWGRNIYGKLAELTDAVSRNSSTV
jgi:hypothetical protein